MADYVGLAVAIGQVISSLVAVVVSAKAAPKDIQDLQCELLCGLYTIRGNSLSFDDLPDQSRNKLEDTNWRRCAYESIMSMMENDVRHHPSAFGRTKQYATWHWDKKKVKEHLEKIERIKSWFMFSTINDVTYVLLFSFPLQIVLIDRD
jgi:hypothetical protein